MTDNEIVKALECCHSLGVGCVGCPFDGETDCLCKSGEAILDLINRQKAEIEELTKLLKSRHRAIEHLEGVIVSLPDEVRAEAIKEFAEKVKDIVDEPALIRGRVIDTIIARIDNLVKEMTEERNGRIQ